MRNYPPHVGRHPHDGGMEMQEICNGGAGDDRESDPGGYHAAGGDLTIRICCIGGNQE